MRKLLLILVFLSAKSVDAQLYLVMTIPDSLKENADWVIRSQEMVLTIKSPEKFSLKTREVRTLLNEEAKGEATYVTGYDRFCNIRSLEGTLYNVLGMPVRTTKHSDWQDQSAPDGFSLMTDRRYKFASMQPTAYPATVAYEEEDDYSGTQAFPNWMPLPHSRVSVEYSSYTIIAPDGYKVRFQASNGAPEPKIQKGDGKVTYTWSARNLKAVRYESMQPDWEDILPMVRVAPSTFEVDGYAGDMSTWEGYGKFMYQLIKGRDVLPAETRAKVHELTDSLSTDREKINALYAYMQQNTHYISVQLGIGGWQPFDATYVATKKYGDCKALSNFMIALLKEAGIKGKYVEIEGSHTPSTFQESFPSSQSNHVICCVPLARDTVWLECTSQTVSPGYMGGFTGNRKAVLIDETGGKIVHTPVYGLQENQTLRRIDAVVDANGNLDAKMSTRYRGLDQEIAHGLLREASPDERTRYLNGYFDLPNYKVVSQKYSELRGTIPEIQEQLDLTSENYAVQTGRRLFLKPILLKETRGSGFADSVRKYDILIRETHLQRDTICIRIPSGYKLESGPRDQKLEAPIGSYSLTCKFEGDQLCCIRETIVRAGQYPARDYQAIKTFEERKRALDKSRFVFVKNE